jgi:hypothetical protein
MKRKEKERLLKDNNFMLQAIMKSLDIQTRDSVGGTLPPDDDEN